MYAASCHIVSRKSIGSMTDCRQSPRMDHPVGSPSLEINRMDGWYRTIQDRQRTEIVGSGRILQFLVRYFLDLGAFFIRLAAGWNPTWVWGLWLFCPQWRHMLYPSSIASCSACTFPILLWLCDFLMIELFRSNSSSLIFCSRAASCIVRTV